MACVTLKRSCDFDLLDPTSNKRHKFNHSFNEEIEETDTPKQTSPFVPSEPYSQYELRKRVKDELKRLQRRRLAPRLACSPYPDQATAVYRRKFSEALASCSGSLRSLALRSPQHNQVNMTFTGSSSTNYNNADSDSSSSESSPPRDSLRQSLPTFLASSIATRFGSPPPPQSPSTSLSSIVGQERSSANQSSLDTTPLFTLPQVVALTDRLIKEREDELREEYDSILTQKLAEQYDAFAKFSQDQVYSRFQNAPMSYVS